jgi:hypothetical protein
MSNVSKLEALPLSALVLVYNAAASRPVKKFSTKPEAVKRALSALGGRDFEIANGKVSFTTASAHTISASELKPAKGGKGEMPAFLVRKNETPEQKAAREQSFKDEAVRRAAKAAEEAAKAPVQKAMPLKKGKKAGGRATYAVHQKITVVKKPEGRDGTNRAARAAVLKTGMRVDEYLAKAAAANRGKRPAHKYHADLRRYVAEGFITIA